MEIDHILISIHWRILQNCRVYQSAEFLMTDHRLISATLTLHIRSQSLSSCHTLVFHLNRLKDLQCAEEFAVTISSWFEVFDTMDDSVKLWDTFKHVTFQAAKDCIEELPQFRGRFALVEMLECVKESCTARLAGNCDQHKRRIPQLHRSTSLDELIPPSCL